MMFISVDFPAPFSPRTARISARKQVQVDVPIGHNPWEVLVIPRTSRTGWGMFRRLPGGLMPQANPFGHRCGVHALVSRK